MREREKEKDEKGMKRWDGDKEKEEWTQASFITK